ncbi:hypothetical protein T459_13564 [Capsicum annuum]|uniref:Kinesin motor domain-containing protein n=1 Tax=Capsicum annuum TaxID=4072 RepID=A0A2G2ZEW9_CAPAN|nr:hypothetical protein T459_13564 [Capsicum annuum]
MNGNGLPLPDASVHPVNCARDVIDLMKLGDVNRAVGSTSMNNRSSLSHSVLTVHVHGEDTSGNIIHSCLHLVDLAALAQKNSHIPYRNSKLTLLLQNFLSGHAKTLMFAHVGPEGNSFGETISTLKFAQRVSSVELGATRLNKESVEVLELKAEFHKDSSGPPFAFRSQDTPQTPASSLKYQHAPRSPTSGFKSQQPPRSPTSSLMSCNAPRSPTSASIQR